MKNCTIFESSDDMMINTASPLKRQSLAEEVASRLQQQIASGKYKKGEQLPTEPELMQQFGVGRSSIREAIRILVNTGMIRVQQGVGTFILSQEALNEPLTKRLERAHFHELDEVRLLLEVKIAEKAALNRTAKDIAKMKSLLKQRATCAFNNDPAGCIDADIVFHSTVAEASRNQIMVDLYKTIAAHLKQAFLERYEDTRSFRDSQGLHEDLLQSIIDKDPARALVMATRISTHGSK